VPLCAEALGEPRSMNTTHLWILCRYAAKVHISAAPRLLSGYHVLNRPVGIHISATI